MCPSQHSLINEFCIFGLSSLGLSFNFRLDSIYTFRDIAVVRLWHFGWKIQIRANIRQF